jgi:hypothetical protein
MAKTNAHETCLHPATANMRNKCRKVRAAIAEMIPSTNAELEGKIGTAVIAWRTEDSETTGPKLIKHEGILERSYDHADGYMVWIVVSDDKPQGTGHIAWFVHVA